MIFLFDFTLFAIYIHHSMLISLFSAPFDHFHFHPTLGLDPALILALRHKNLMKQGQTAVYHNTLMKAVYFLMQNIFLKNKALGALGIASDNQSIMLFQV